MREIRSLTGLRGVAALCVVVVHGGFDHAWWVYMWTFPDAAVDLFFCLSGFTLCLVYKPNEIRSLALFDYFRARVARIYPLYALSLVLMWWMVFRHLAGSGFYPAPLYRLDVARDFLMVNSWPLIGSGTNWNFPAWSLSVEVFCYIFLLPMFVHFYGRVRRAPDGVKVGTSLLLSLASVLMFTHFWNGNLVSVHICHVRPITFWMPMLRGVTMFSCGCVMYVLLETRSRVAGFCGRHVDALALLTIFSLGLCEVGPHYKDAIAIYAPFLILGLAVNEGSRSSRFLRSRWVYLLGVISYSLYVLHVPVDYELHHVWPALQGHQVVDVAVTLALTVAVSVFSYVCFEMPMRRLIRGIGFRRVGVVV